jgi:chromosome partitioning protein
MPIIIALISQKGGVGKSALSRALAVEAARNGFTAHIADLDAQQFTATEWASLRARGRFEPSVTATTYTTLKQALDGMPRCDMLILDGPARTSAGTLDIAKIADLVIQPTGAGRDDLDPAIRTFHELVAKRIASRKLVMVLSRILGDSEAKEARRYIVDAGYAVADGHVIERISYRTAMNIGRALTETEYDTLNDKAREVVTNLVNRIQEKAAA